MNRNLSSVVRLDQVFDALQTGGHRGEVHARLEGGQARLVADGGEIVAASFGDLEGEEALGEVLRRASEVREIHWYPEGSESSGSHARWAAEQLIESQDDQAPHSGISPIGGARAQTGRPAGSARDERWSRLRRLCPPLGSVLLPEIRALVSLPDEISDRGRAVLDLVDGWRSILEIVGDSDLDPSDALEGVHQLISHGLVSVVEV